MFNKLTFKQYLDLMEQDQLSQLDTQLAQIKNQQAITLAQKARDTKKYDDKNVQLQRTVMSLTQKQAAEQKRVNAEQAKNDKAANQKPGTQPAQTAQTGFQGQQAPGKASFP